MRVQVWAFVALGWIAASGCKSGSSGGGGGNGGGTPTYWADVMPILDANCVGCHTPGGIGPFSLEGYANAFASAASVRSATGSRYMPPSNIDNSGACNTWSDARWLADADIQTIADWADAGAPEGDPADAPTPNPTPTPALGGVDATLDIGVDYAPPTTQPDEYRCFVVDPGVAAGQYLVGYEAKPGNPQIVHHVVLFTLESAQAQTDAEALDAGSAEPGYTCFGGAQVPANIVSVWAPGTGVTLFPQDTGIQLPAGRKVVLQIHYNTSAATGTDRTTIDLDVEASVTRPALLAPIGVGGFTIPPGEDSYAVSQSAASPASATVHMVYPHMHKRGETLTVTKNGDCMVDVPRWDFGWQQFFRASTPLSVQNGDALSITCTYDTQNDTSPIPAGEGTDEEMCGVGLYVTVP